MGGRTGRPSTLGGECESSLFGDGEGPAMRLCIFITSRNQQLPATARPPLFCSWLHQRASTLSTRTARYSNHYNNLDWPSPRFSRPEPRTVSRFREQLQTQHCRPSGVACSTGRSCVSPEASFAPIQSLPTFAITDTKKRDKRSPSHTEQRRSSEAFAQKKPCYAS